MTTNPVESSMISRIGYSPDANLLRVVMSDGTVYDCPAVSEREYAALMDSQSKGNFWHQHFKGRASRNDGAMPDAAAPHVLELREPAPIGPLETFAEDDCCTARLALDNNRRKSVLQPLPGTVLYWTCPKCGTKWRPEKVGSIIHWKPVPDIFVIPGVR